VLSVDVPLDMPGDENSLYKGSFSSCFETDFLLSHTFVAAKKNVYAKVSIASIPNNDEAIFTGEFENEVSMCWCVLKFVH